LRILFDIGHPAHVHFFRHVISILEGDGHEILVTAREKEVTYHLLKAYNIPFTPRGGFRKGMLDKAFGLLKTDYQMYKIAKAFQPDILIGVHNPYIAHISRLLNKPSIIFTDTERVGIASTLTFPFADVVLTPSCFTETIDRKKQVFINGYKELAYLHPNQFTPDISVLDDLGLKVGENFIILRFISWGASHDTNLHGVVKGSEADIAKTLSEYGRVFVTSEKELDPLLEPYRISVPPEKIHSLLYYASLYFGEGGTMATESAVLGTPSIHVESTDEGIATGNFIGNYLDLRNNYDLLHFFPDQVSALEKAREILQNPSSKSEWQKKRNILIQEKTDVTRWMVDFIEKYPESFKRLVQK
jgi:uncharacterized protein